MSLMKSGSVDAISSLQDELLAKILSFLTTKEATSTVLLSKRWSNLLPLMKHLFGSQHHYCLDDSEFLHPDKRRDDSDYSTDDSFCDFVDKTLSGDNFFMKKLSLRCRDERFCSDLADQWIHKALERGVVDLDLRLAWDINLLPPSFFTNKTLVKLTLGLQVWAETIDLKEVSLPVLKSLVLHTDWFIADFLFYVMLPGCPILEELSLHYSRMYRKSPAEDLWISHDTLKRLTIHDHNGYNYCSFKEFYMPSLVYFDYSGFAPLMYYSTAGFTRSLVEAKLDFRMQVSYDGSHYIYMIIQGIRNIKTLSLTSASVEMMMWLNKELPLFQNLVKLSFESEKQEDWEVLPRLLNKSPKLETLVLRGFHCFKDQGICIVPSEVKVLEIYGFRGSGEELRQVEGLLCQMQFLQLMKVEIEADDNEKRQLVTRELLALYKPSSEFQIQFL